MSQPRPQDAARSKKGIVATRSGTLWRVDSSLRFASSGAGMDPNTQVQTEQKCCSEPVVQRGSWKFHLFSWFSGYFSTWRSPMMEPTFRSNHGADVPGALDNLHFAELFTVHRHPIQLLVATVVAILFRPKPIRTISGFLELISRFEFEFCRCVNFFEGSNLWCVHVNVPWPVCAHAIPFRMLWLPRRLMITYIYRVFRWLGPFPTHD